MSDEVESLRVQGKVLVHYCQDWDGKLIHGEMEEITSCTCFFTNHLDRFLKQEMIQRHQSKIFSADGAPSHSGTILNFPTSSDQMLSIDGVFAQLKLAKVENCVVLFFNPEDDGPNWLTSGNEITRKDFLWLLESAKHKMMVDQGE